MYVYFNSIYLKNIYSYRSTYWFNKQKTLVTMSIPRLNHEPAQNPEARIWKPDALLATLQKLRQDQIHRLWGWLGWKQLLKSLALGLIMLSSPSSFSSGMDLKNKQSPFGFQDML